MFHLLARRLPPVEWTSLDSCSQRAPRRPSSWQRLTVKTWRWLAGALGARFDCDLVDTSPEQFARQFAALKERFSRIDTTDLERYRSERPALPPGEMP